MIPAAFLQGALESRVLTAPGQCVRTFKELDLIEPLQRAIAAQDYHTPTPIQAQSIPPLLQGRDMLASAQTGTGKTAAFALPVLQHLHNTQTQGRRHIRAVVLSPTRELASQIDASFRTYGKHLSLQTAVVFGGVNENPQIQKLKRGVDIIVGCPGRFLDLLGRGFIDLSHVECFILDEADRMLDMGFINDIKRIMRQLPKQRQNLLFSATMPGTIVELANQLLHDPVRVEITPEAPTVEAIEQSLMYVAKADKKQLMIDLLQDLDYERVIVFTRTKHGANRLTKQLAGAGFLATAIHGNKSQNARRKALDGFRKGEFEILIATDVASRGIDVEEITHVFNYDLPDDAESYVHRIGRTARAGREGVAISFCGLEEGQNLLDVEKVIGKEIPVNEDHPYHLPEAIPTRRGGPGGGHGNKRPGGGRSGGGGRGGSRGGGGGRGGSSRGGGGRGGSRGGRGRSRSDDSGQSSSQEGGSPKQAPAQNAKPSPRPEGGSGGGEGQRKRRRRRRGRGGQSGGGSSS